MARKKKEEIKEELATPVATTEPVAVTENKEETAPTVAVEEKTEPKKTAKTAKPAKKTTPKVKTKSQVKDQKEQSLKGENEVEETKGQETTEPVVETLQEEPKTAEKPKKERKTKAKKDAEKTVDKTKNIEKTDSVPPIKEQKKAVTRAEKNETIKSLVKDLLAVRPYKWSELLAESERLYTQKIEENDGHVSNDVRGRVGSVFDIMKKDGEVVFEGGMYALKQSSEKKEDEKTVVETQENTIENTEIKEKQLPAVKEKAEIAPVFDMTALLTAKKDVAKQENKEETVEKPVVKEEKGEPKKKTEKKQSEKVEKTAPKVQAKKQEKRVVERKPTRASGNKLKETFLKKIRALGGKYFEYYSIYLLERYSLKNGRRVEGFKISGGENDGGIDGEIEVSDRIGFRETIYIQAKNWKPIYGKEDSWVIGETALREFIGAVAYRQAKEGKQHCRGIFITTSYFTAGSKEMLQEMSDKFVGYDGDDLFEAAKECSFGLIEKDGEWQLDERLLAGDKAFFNL